MIAYEPPRCIVIENLTAANDDFSKGFFNDAVTSVWCTGTCTTKATFTLGNAMTITGTSPTCQNIDTTPTAATVPAANQLTARESLRFDVINAVFPETDQYELYVSYPLDAQSVLIVVSSDEGLSGDFLLSYLRPAPTEIKKK